MTDPIETKPVPEQLSVEKESASPSPPYGPSRATDESRGSEGAVAPPIISSVPIPVQAGFVRRALAFIMDLFLINFLYLLLALFGVVGISMASEKGFMSWPLDQLIMPFFSAGMLLFMGYFTFFHAMEGQTPAKKILRIKVVKADGNRLSHGATFLRCSLGYFLSFYFFGFGFLMALFGSKKRALHDFLTGSYVILSND